MSITSVFLSYSRTDFKRVEKIAEALMEAGFDVWYDRNLKAGDPWTEELERHLLESDVVVVALSSASSSSKWVRREITFADGSNKPFVAVQLEEIGRASCRERVYARV